MSQPPVLPAVIAGRYRVLKELGRGGMGAVYRVEHLHTGDELALKIMLSTSAVDSSAIERFRREARASSQIKSEHVVRVIDADAAPELGGAPFLVMELLDGCDLSGYLELRGPMEPAEVVGVFTQVARALDRAHSIGIVHRDLKPENLFLHRREDGSSVLKILDFGISKFGGAAGEGVVGLTSTGALLGTPLYMSPEQARGEPRLMGPPTDVWALGLIAFTLLTNTIYWQAETVADLLVSILVSPMAPPSARAPKLPPAFDAWFARSCDRDPALRFPSVGQQSAALAEAFGFAVEGRPSLGVPQAPAGSWVRPAAAPGASRPDEPSVHATAEPLSRTTPAARGRPRWLALSLAASALVIGGGAYAFLHVFVQAPVPAPVAQPSPRAAKLDPSPPVPAASLAPLAALAASPSGSASPPLAASVPVAPPHRPAPPPPTRPAVETSSGPPRQPPPPASTRAAFNPDAP